MTKESRQFSGRIGVTSSVAAPGDTDSSDATVDGSALMSTVEELSRRQRQRTASAFGQRRDG